MLTEKYGVEGKVAIVTGGGRGMGKSIALILAGAGADVTVVARTKVQIEQTAEEIRRLGRKALAIPTDVTKEAQVKKAVEQQMDRMQRRRRGFGMMGGPGGQGGHADKADLAEAGLTEAGSAEHDAAVQAVRAAHKEAEALNSDEPHPGAFAAGRR